MLVPNHCLYKRKVDRMILNEAILAHSDLLLEGQANRYIPVANTQVAKIPGLCLGFVPGIMPGKWLNRWHQRYSALASLTDVALADSKGLSALDAFADMVLLRAEDEPAACHKSLYHSVELYREVPVLVLPKDHLLTLVETVPVADLGEELLLQDTSEIPGWRLSRQTRSQAELQLIAASMRGRADAFELVAAGLGLLVVPMSIARFYHRKELTYRPIEGLESYRVLLVWKHQIAEEDKDREALIQDFVGITRGRTATSQRGSDSRPTALVKRNPQKKDNQVRQQATKKRHRLEAPQTRKTHKTSKSTHQGGRRNDRGKKR